MVFRAAPGLVTCGLPHREDSGMLRGSAVRRSSTPGPPPPVYPDGLLPQIRHALSALADIEFRCEIDRERLRAWAGPEAIRNRLAEELEQRCRAEREPCSRRLTELQRHLAMLMAGDDISRPV